MITHKHGLSIGLQRVNKEFYLYLKAIGKLTHEDYQIITPMLDKALKEIKEPKIKALFDCSELEGWEIKAAWDDLKLGLKHGNEFDKIAIITNKSWLEIGAKISSWFISGEIETFKAEKEALSWLNK